MQMEERKEEPCSTGKEIDTRAFDTTSQLPSGTSLGIDDIPFPTHFEILEIIGNGAMGVVFKARHKLLDRIAAIKVCLAHTDANRFQREAQILAKLDSPNIVAVHDFHVLSNKRMLLVMDWIDGKNLEELRVQCKGRVSLADASNWMKQVCLGMSAAAKQGVVHRDLKPSNILVTEQGQVKIADFGLAQSDVYENLTANGNMMGTPAYMSPEQAEDPLQADSRSDIYSFGATFFHLLTGEPPFSGKSIFSILMKHKTEPVVSPLSINPAIGTRVASCLERCLAKSPRDRFQCFDSLYEHLCSLDENAIAWDIGQDPLLDNLNQQYQKRRNFYLLSSQWSPDQKSPEEDIYRLPNSRVVSITQGDITKQKVDVIVSSEDSKIDSGIAGGVADSLRMAGGEDYVSVARKYAPVRLGRAIAVPSAGELPCKFIFLAVTTGLVEGDKTRFLRPSRDIVNSILESCIYQADSLDVKSIAFPLLGTGNAGLAREVCLDVMFSYLMRALNRGLTNIQEARIVIYAKPGI